MKKHFIRAISLLLALITLIFALSSCGKTPDGDENAPDNKPSDISGTAPADKTDTGGKQDSGAVTVYCNGEARFTVIPGKLDYTVPGSKDGCIVISYGNSEYLELMFTETSKNAEALAPSFIDSYVDYTDIEFSGSNPVPDTEFYAETVSAHNDDTIADAYLIDVPGGVVSAVFRRYASDKIADALWDTFITLEII